MQQPSAAQSGATENGSEGPEVVSSQIANEVPMRCGAMALCFVANLGEIGCDDLTGTEFRICTAQIGEEPLHRGKDGSGEVGVSQARAELGVDSKWNEFRVDGPSVV